MITRYVEPPPRIIEQPVIRTYRPPTPVLSRPVEYIDERPRVRTVVLEKRRQPSSYSVEGKLDPYLVDDDTVYLKYNATGRRDPEINGYGPRARIIELDDNDKPVYTTNSSQKVYESRGHYEPALMNTSTDYFSGRRDFTMDR